MESLRGNFAALGHRPTILIFEADVPKFRANSADRRPPSVAVYRRLLRYADPYRGTVIFSGLLLIAATGLGLLWPLVVREVLDVGLTDTAVLDRLVPLLVAVLLLRTAADGLRSFFMSYVGEHVIYDLRVAIARHLYSLPLSFFHDRKSGELTSHVTSDASVVHQVVTTTILTVLGQILTLVGGFAIIFSMNWSLALLTFVVAPPVAIIGTFLGRRVRVLARDAKEAQAEAIGVLQEALSEMRTVQLFARELYEAERFEVRLTTHLGRMMRRARLGSSVTPLITFLGASATIIVLWYGGHQVARGDATTGEIVAFFLYIGMISGPVGGLAAQWVQMQEAFGAADRLFAILDVTPEVRDAPTARRLPRGAGEVTFEGVSFRYGRGPLVLHDVSVRVRAGATTALVGPSGAGKTTFVDLVGRFYEPTTGRILIDGTDLRDVTLRSLREQIAVVPQEPILFAATIRDNIAYGRLDATDEEIRAAAHAANATEFIARLPAGLDTLVGERGVKLSIGQRQRVAIARAIIRDATMLLLDEATSALDNESEFLVQQALARLTGGRTTIVIAHRLTTVERADNILVLDEGRIVEKGTHAQLLGRRGLYRRLHERAFLDSDRDLASVAVQTGA